MRDDVSSDPPLESFIVKNHNICKFLYLRWASPDQVSMGVRNRLNMSLYQSLNPTMIRGSMSSICVGCPTSHTLDAFFYKNNAMSRGSIRPTHVTTHYRPMVYTIHFLFHITDPTWDLPSTLVQFYLICNNLKYTSNDNMI